MLNPVKLTSNSSIFQGIFSKTRLGSRLYPTTLRGKIYRQKLSRQKLSRLKLSRLRPYRHRLPRLRLMGLGFIGSSSMGLRLGVGVGVQRNYILLLES